MRSLSSLLLLAATVVPSQAQTSPKAESEDLLNAAVPFAQQMLAKHGEFFPYGQAIDKSGKVVAVAATDSRERPPSADLINILKKAFRAGALGGKYKATALVYDVRIILPGTANKSDAIAVSLNHEGNYSALVFMPYRIEGKNVVMGEAIAEPEENYVFKPKP